MEQDIQMQRQPFANQAGRTLYCLKKTFVLGYGKKCTVIWEYLELDSSVLAIENKNFKAFLLFIWENHITTTLSNVNSLNSSHFSNKLWIV